MDDDTFYELFDILNILIGLVPEGEVPAADARESLENRLNDLETSHWRNKDG